MRPLWFLKNETGWIHICLKLCVALWGKWKKMFVKMTVKEAGKGRYTHSHRGTSTNNNRTDMTNRIQTLSNQREQRKKWMDRATEKKRHWALVEAPCNMQSPMKNIARLFLADRLMYALSGREIWWGNLISWINQTNDVISKNHNKP